MANEGMSEIVDRTVHSYQCTKEPTSSAPLLGTFVVGYRGGSIAIIAHTILKDHVEPHRPGGHPQRVFAQMSAEKEGVKKHNDEAARGGAWQHSESLC